MKKTILFKSTMLASCLVATLIAAGCATSNYSEPTPVVAPAPAAKPVTAVSPAAKPTTTPAASTGTGSKTACTESTSGLIRLSKTMPVEASLGTEFVTELTITAQGCAANVVVRDTLPAGASYVRSEPAATVEGNQLIWNIGNMDAGQSIKGKVVLKADKEGTLVNCATVSADARVCASILVGRPVITID